MPWVMGMAEEGLREGHLWDIGLRRLENHLFIGMCVGWFLWKSNTAPRKPGASSPRPRALNYQDSPRMSSLCHDGQWQRDSVLVLGFPGPGLWGGLQSLGFLQATLNHIVALSYGLREPLRVFKQRNDIVGFALPSAMFPGAP